MLPIIAWIRTFSLSRSVTLSLTVPANLKIERRMIQNRCHFCQRFVMWCQFVMWTLYKNKEAFFLRHIALLPSSTSQLVLFHHLFCIHFWGGVHFCVHFCGGGVHFCVHFQGGPLPCSLPGGSTSMFTSGGGPLPCSLLGGPLPCSLLGGSTSIFTSGGGSLPCSLLGGSHVTYPIMLLYTTIELPSASWAKFTWDPPLELNRLTDWQTNSTENITFPHYIAGSNYTRLSSSIVSFQNVTCHSNTNQFSHLHWSCKESVFEIIFETSQTEPCCLGTNK